MRLDNQLLCFPWLTWLKTMCLIFRLATLVTYVKLSNHWAFDKDAQQFTTQFLKCIYNCVPGKDFVSRKRRRHRKGHHNSHKTDQVVMSSASGALQARESLLNTDDSLPVANSSLTKNQKRKLKKKRKEKEKRSQSSSIIEFTFDSCKLLTVVVIM